MSDKRFTNRVPLPAPKGDDIPWIAIIVLLAVPGYPVTQLIALGLFISKMHTRKLRKDYDRMRSILNVLGEKHYISIRELMKTLARPRSELIETLNTMINRGYLGREAYIDHSKDVLIIDRAYENAAKSGRSGAALHVDFDFEEFKNIAGDIIQNVKKSFAGFYSAPGSENGDAEASGASGNSGNSTAAGTAGASHSSGAAGASNNSGAAGSSGHAGAAFSGNNSAKNSTVRDARPNQPDSPRKGHQDILDKLKLLNDQIIDVAVSAKIERIAQLTDNIYEVVEQNPDRAGEVRKFMNYYLPTTIKLLGSYAMLERQSYQGENIIASRRNIEEILDTLVHAFEKQLDRLFAAEAVDISSDIKVLETMIAKDGLAQQAMQLKL